jgi:hypothetical protein
MASTVILTVYAEDRTLNVQAEQTTMFVGGGGTGSTLGALTLEEPFTATVDVLIPAPVPATPIRPRIARALARQPMNETMPLTYVQPAEEP